MTFMRFALLLTLTFSFALASTAAVQASDPPAARQFPKGEWVSLFNGKDLTGWTPKIRHHEAGDNFANTFRVEEGLLSVRYDGYEEFNETFGHLFYNVPFSKYRFRCEYRFVGDQCKGGPGWALRNSGVMIHGELATEMELDQDFPASVEVQLLGGPEQGKRATGNLCTPYTHVVMNGELFKPHCINSSSETYPGEQWVTCEIECHGNGVIKHLINGKVVLEYEQSQLDESKEHSKMLAEKAGTVQLSGGTISLQSESHPCDFRNIEIMLLDE